MFKKSVEEIQIALKSVKNNGYFTRRPLHIYGIYLHSSYNEKCFPDTSSKENQNTLFIFSITFFRKSYRLWDNVEIYSAGQAIDVTIIRGMRFSCWIPMATNTHSEYVILVAFPRQQQLHESSSILRYTYSTMLVLSPSRSVLSKLQSSGYNKER